MHKVLVLTVNTSTKKSLDKKEFIKLLNIPNMFQHRGTIHRELQNKIIQVHHLRLCSSLSVFKML